MGWPSASSSGLGGPSSPPPPPPRRPSDTTPPPAYDETWHSTEPLTPMLSPQHAWQTGDPRSSSTQSLTQHLRVDDGRRVLLIVYIHGFMGNNTSFRSFPAHVHYYLKSALEESHVIHSKVYPRYKTYKAIEVARDNFSKWLEPHESNNTDVVLIGHSMGGLLAAEVALMPSPNPVYGHPFKHRILGTVSLDAPLLGLHPGIIKSGIASLFRKAPDPPGQQQELADSLASQNASGSLSPDGRMSLSTDGASYTSGMTSTSTLTGTSSDVPGPSHQDPNFDPPFFNDVQFVDRGWWKNVAHFAKKHYNEGLFNSTYEHLTSHLTFGSCLADYPGMNNRYNKIRRLEDVDELSQEARKSGRRVARVRFVNYYTVSTGIPKPQPAMPKRADTHLRPQSPGSARSSRAGSGTSTPRISIQDYSDGEAPQTMQVLDPVPLSDSEPEQDNVAESSLSKDDSKGKTPAPENGEQAAVDGSSQDHDKVESATPAASEPHTQDKGDENDEFTHDLPEIPAAPAAPGAPDYARYTDKDARKQAEKEFKRVLKTYDQAIKNREKALKERQKLVEKRRKRAQKEADKRAKDEEKRLAREQKEAATLQQKKAKQDDDDDGENNEAEADAAAAAAAAPASSRAQVVTQAQAQALERRLTDLALHSPDRPDRSRTSPSPFAPPEGENDEEEEEEENAIVRAAGATTAEQEAGADETNGKKKKLRKFCMLPPKAKGARDPCWVKVYMKDVDEVGAHCGLFFNGPHYEKLVGDVGGMVVGWVHEDMSKRAILALE